MKSVCYDSVLLTDKTEYQLFEDSDDELSERVSSIIENKIVKWFFEHPYNFTPSLFYEELGIDTDYKAFFEVRKHIIKDEGKPGDIDILLINQHKPQYSIAFQVKRVRAIINEQDEAILQTKDIEKGIVQTRKMFEKYRFHRSFLMIVIVVDAQNRTNNQQLFRHLSYPEKKAVYFHKRYGDLPEEVGIYILEIDQPSLNSIDRTSRISSKTLKSAKVVDQLNITTESILQLLSSHS